MSEKRSYRTGALYERTDGFGAPGAVSSPVSLIGTRRTLRRLLDTRSEGVRSHAKL
jgi:hypothetical protein